MKYIFGPVPSRRLGWSLGVDLVPMKTCTLSCRYCQIGETPRTTLDRRPWIPVDEVIYELEQRLEQIQKPDWISFSGSGEPTLNSDIGRALAMAKAITDIPVCVITNGTLLWMPEVCEALLHADAVLPSLDSAVEETFQTLCQPVKGLTAAKIVEGLISFRKKYTGRIWLEILFATGYNDSDNEIGALADAVSRIQPDKIHLNTVVRPPADSELLSVPYERLEAIRERFGSIAEIIVPFREQARQTEDTDPDAILAYLRRRPGNTGDIAAALDADREKVERMLMMLAGAGDIHQVCYHGKKYWEAARS